MSKILAVHQCEETPHGFVVMKSGTNGWVIATKDGDLCETVVIGIKGCPFCLENLKEE